MYKPENPIGQQNMMLKGPSPTLVWNEHGDPIRNLYDPKEYTNDIPPIWADILFSGIKNKDKIEKTFKKWEKDPSLAEPALKGLLGQYMLNELLPSNVKVDLKDKKLNYQANDRLNIGLREKDNTKFLDLGWRF
jgi:hypothetical protein